MASYAATKVRPDGLILEAGFPDVRTLFRGSLMSVLLPFSSYRFPAAEYVKQAGCPILVMHGDADRVIPFAAGRPCSKRRRSRSGSRRSAAAITTTKSRPIPSATGRWLASSSSRQAAPHLKGGNYKGRTRGVGSETVITGGASATVAARRMPLNRPSNTGPWKGSTTYQ